MQELTTTANLVDWASLEDRESITTVIARSELEAAHAADERAALWLELGRDEDEELRRLTIELGPAEIEEMLRLAREDDVVFAIAADPVLSLFDEPDVEAHGLRGALAIAVVAAAVGAPTSLAAAPQTANVSASPQQVRAATTAQQVDAAATRQVASPAAKTQVAKVHVAKTQVAKTQIAKTLVLKSAGLTLLRGKQAH
jgi:hypothetical protein